MKSRTGESNEARRDAKRTGPVAGQARTDGGDGRLRHTLSPDGAVTADASGVYLAKQLAREGRIRNEVLPGIDEARWMILLDIYVAMRRARDTPFMSAAHASSAPTSTAQRYIHEMTSRGLIAQERSGQDQRTTHVRLTDQGLDLIDQVLRRIEALRRA